MHIKLLRPKSAAKVPHVSGDRPEMVDEDGLLSDKRLRDSKIQKVPNIVLALF